MDNFYNNYNIFNELIKEKEQYEIAQKLKWYADLLRITDEKQSDEAEELVNSYIKAELDVIVEEMSKEEAIASPSPIQRKLFYA